MCKVQGVSNCEYKFLALRAENPHFDTPVIFQTNPKLVVLTFQAEKSFNVRLFYSYSGDRLSRRTGYKLEKRSIEDVYCFIEEFSLSRVTYYKYMWRSVDFLDFEVNGWHPGGVPCRVPCRI
jgi:hypothetical protein